MRIALLVAAVAETPPFVRCDWQGADDKAMQLRETGRPPARRHRQRDEPGGDGPAPRPQQDVPAAQVHLAPPGYDLPQPGSGHGFRVSVEKQERF